MPLQLPGISNIETSLAAMRPQSMSSVLANIRAEQRENRKLELQRMTEERLTRGQIIDAYQTAQLRRVQEAAEKRLEKQRETNRLNIIFDNAIAAGKENPKMFQQILKDNNFPNAENLSLVEDDGIPSMTLGAPGSGSAIKVSGGRLFEYYDMLKSKPDIASKIAQNPNLGYMMMQRQYGLKIEPVSKSAKMFASEKDYARDRKIQSYIDLGIAKDRTEATKLADGVYKFWNDDLGNAYIIDMSDQSVVRPAEGTPTPTTKKTTGEPFITKEDVRLGTGPPSMMKQAINRLVGWAFEGIPFEETSRARGRIRTFNQRMKPQLKVSRMGAKFDIENIDAILPKPDRFFEDPDTGIQDLQNLYDLVNGTLTEKKRILSEDVTSQKQRQELVSDIGKLNEALALMPDKEVLFGKSQQLTENKIMSMTADDIKALNIATLTEDQKKALLRRVKQLRAEQE